MRRPATGTRRVPLLQPHTGRPRASSSATASIRSPATAHRPIPIGRPIRDTRRLRAGRARGLRAGRRARRAVHRRRRLARGYVGRPDADRRALRRRPVRRPGERLYRTGDLVRWLADGSCSSSAAWTTRSRCAASGSSWARSRPLWRPPRRARRCRACRARTPTATSGWWPTSSRSATASASCRRAGSEATPVAQWQTLYDETYGSEHPSDRRDFDIVGWNSSYTGEPLGPAEMARVGARPRCSALARCARGACSRSAAARGCCCCAWRPRCERYVGHRLLRRRPREPGAARSRDLPQVQLLQRSAEDCSGLPVGAFDLIVLNSVVQYFPSIGYLVRVLDALVPLLAPGGRLIARRRAPPRAAAGAARVAGAVQGRRGRDARRSWPRAYSDR